MMPDYTDPILEATVRYLRRLWGFCLFLPIAYLLSSLAIKRWWFEPRELYFGLLALSDTTYFVLLVIGGVLAVAFQLAIISFKRIGVRRMGEDAAAGASPIVLAAHLRTRTFILLALCDLIGFIGLLIFLASGQVFATFMFGLISLMFYLQSRPADFGK